VELATEQQGQWHIHFRVVTVVKLQDCFRMFSPVVFAFINSLKI